MLDRSVSELLDDIAAQTPAPGGGAVSAVAVAMSAGLVGMAARFSVEYLEGAKDLAEKADVIRAHVAPLGQADADAYSALLRALRLPGDDPSRDEAVAAATVEAARIPLEIAAFAAQTSLIAARLAAEGNSNLAGDAVTAALVSAAAARACATLVRINLDDTAEEFAQAAEHARVADAAAGRALSALR